MSPLFKILQMFIFIPYFYRIKSKLPSLAFKAPPISPQHLRSFPPPGNCAFLTPNPVIAISLAAIHAVVSPFLEYDPHSPQRMTSRL